MLSAGSKGGVVEGVGLKTGVSRGVLGQEWQLRKDRKVGTLFSTHTHTQKRDGEEGEEEAEMLRVCGRKLSLEIHVKRTAITSTSRDLKGSPPVK